MRVEIRHINATTFYAYQICRREAWFYFHRLNPPQEHELLDLGRLVHESSYSRFRKEIFVDQLLKIDLFQGELVAEVKRSSRHLEGAKLQLAYYLYFLSKEKGLNLRGILLFPKERKTVRLELTPEIERKIEEIVQEMTTVLEKAQPPPPVRTRYCRSCSFMEICWG